MNDACELYRETSLKLHNRPQAHLGQSAELPNAATSGRISSGQAQSASVRGAGVAACECMAKGMCVRGGGNSLPLENKHCASERQRPLQTRGNVSPPSIPWQWIPLVLEGGSGLLSPVYFTQSSEGEKPQDVNRRLGAHCFFSTFRSLLKTQKCMAYSLPLLPV